MRNLRLILCLVLLFAALGSIGCSHSSSPQPSAASKSTAPAVAMATIQLNWSANANEQTGFYILQSTDGTTFTNVKTVQEPARSVSVSVVAGATVYFKIQGFNSAGSSPTTSSVTVTTPSP